MRVSLAEVFDPDFDDPSLLGSSAQAFVVGSAVAKAVSAIRARADIGTYWQAPVDNDGVAVQVGPNNLHSLQTIHSPIFDSDGRLVDFRVDNESCSRFARILAEDHETLSAAIAYCPSTSSQTQILTVSGTNRLLSSGALRRKPTKQSHGGGALLETVFGTEIRRTSTVLSFGKNGSLAVFHGGSTFTTHISPVGMLGLHDEGSEPTSPRWIWGHEEIEDCVTRMRDLCQHAIGPFVTFRQANETSATQPPGSLDVLVTVPTPTGEKGWARPARLVRNTTKPQDRRDAGLNPVSVDVLDGSESITVRFSGNDLKALTAYAVQLSLLADAIRVAHFDAEQIDLTYSYRAV